MVSAPEDQREHDFVDMPRKRSRGQNQLSTDIAFRRKPRSSRCTEGKPIVSMQAEGSSCEPRCGSKGSAPLDEDACPQGTTRTGGTVQAKPGGLPVTRLQGSPASP